MKNQIPSTNLQKKDIEDKRRVGSNQIIKVEIKKLITDLNNAPAR